ncbi:amidophosphoribosyltransferase [Candidozyma auris]
MDAAEDVTCGARGRFYQCKGNGMARDVFTQSRMMNLISNMGITHLRYPTAGSSAGWSQPFCVNSPYGIVMFHNGSPDETVHRHINTDSDSELLLNIFASELDKSNKSRVNNQDLFAALTSTMSTIRGAYSCVAMLAGYGVIGFRDPNGIRPLLFGERTNESMVDYMLASESVVLKAHGYNVFRDINPGEAVIIPKAPDANNKPEFRQVVEPKVFSPDISEYVYLARPDSVLDGVSVYRSRIEMERRSSVRRKLNTMESEFKGRNVLLVDDSIVRGTTSKEIVQMAREAGAKTVMIASCAPPIRFNHIYGIDLADTRLLLGWTERKMRLPRLSHDKVFYQDLQDLITAYITGPEDNYIQELEKIRAQNQRLKEVKKGLSVDACIDASDLVDVKTRGESSIHNAGDHHP